MKLLNIAGLFAVAILIVSCATRQVIIPEDLSAAEIIQRAQEASDRNRYNTSLQYYETILERFPGSTEYVLAAEYEIAFIHYKRRNYSLSRTGFNAILERYNDPDAALLPPQYEVLANIVLGRIEEREAGRGR